MLEDSFGRKIEYLRVSLTDRCNLRCRYCMPAEGIDKLRHEDILTLEEIERITRILVAGGVRKVRFTGGEPLIRKGMTDLVRRISSLDEKPAVFMTTNGTLLEEYIDALAAAGLKGVNISLDTLSDQCFEEITGKDMLPAVRRSIAKAAEKGLEVRLNTVLIKGINDNEAELLALISKDIDVSVRFIELMPIGCASALEGIGTDDLIRRFDARFGKHIEVEDGAVSSGPARYVRYPGFKGKTGFISPLSHSFCRTCNRLRLTSDGKIKPCLCSPVYLDVRKLMREDADDDMIRDEIRKIILGKPSGHDLTKTSVADEMPRIGG
ncbi:MAG: GTP 3',8-cyclase MoaA [Clostridiales bacterium]|nr:GTP 3',8-cyclase MoaA [Clostridiales bacterium]